MPIPMGLMLRLVGPLVELACLIALQRFGGQGRTVAGLAIEPLLYGGLGLGLLMVVLGLTWFRPRPRSTRVERSADLDLDLDLRGGR